jgi:1-acyl-sn-glycerol-3-phosphate acyltransferase
MELTLQTNRFSQPLASAILRLLSWKLEVTWPAAAKYVLIGAPHTSGWDLLYTLLFKHATGIQLRWVGKDGLFRGPLGSLLRRLGGIPVNRRTSHNFVQQMVDAFNQRDDLVLTIAPEGTRGKAEYWKTGFYYIALGAGVPIAMGFVDYRQKVVGIGPTIFPSGDIHADFAPIKAFYIKKTGRRPELQGEPKIHAG